MIPANLRAKLVAATAGGVALLSVVLVGQLEGRKTTPYFDSIGILTVCVGHTGNVDARRDYTEAECDELLSGDLHVALDAVNRDVKVPIHPLTRAALVSFTFNVGAKAFHTSLLLKMLNAGQGPPACDQLRRWVYAGKKWNRGLVNRRETERELCIAGFDGGSL